MFRKVTISRSIRTLGTMIRSGVPVLDAIQLSAEVAGNYYLRSSSGGTCSTKSPTAARFATRCAATRSFRGCCVQMIAAGEETGRLDDVLEKVSNYYDREVETWLSRPPPADRADR